MKISKNLKMLVCTVMLTSAICVGYGMEFEAEPECGKRLNFREKVDLYNNTWATTESELQEIFIKYEEQHPHLNIEKHRTTDSFRVIYNYVHRIAKEKKWTLNTQLFKFNNPKHK
jgi:hypothetical protein